MIPNKDEFQFDFGEKSTRKAVVFAAALGVVFFFLFEADMIFDRGYRIDDELWVSLIISAVFVAISFIMGLILFKSGNLSVLLFYPVWYFVLVFLFDSYASDFAELLFNFIVSFIVTMFLLFIAGIAMTWINGGR